MDATSAIPAMMGVLGIGVGAILQYQSSRRLDRRRHFDELRSRAYADFVQAVAAIAFGGRDQDGETAPAALSGLTDAKVRITLYGSKQVVTALAQFSRTDQHLASSSSRQSFVGLIKLMRADTSGRRETDIPGSELETILFGS